VTVAVLLTRLEEAAIITLDRPEALNALSYATLDELAERFAEVARSDARVLIITGAGRKAFCAGADIGELMGRTLAEEKSATERGQRTFLMLDELPIVSVAAINGHALGGGLELALACTFRVATANAMLGLPEIRLGMVPGYGGTQRLPRLIGESRALEIILSGRSVPAEEALRIGLVNRIVDGEPVQAARAYARQFTRLGLVALDLARQSVQRGMQVPLRDGLRIEADLSTLSMRTEDGREGVAAFLEKRSPRFRDR
jgi:enoyl-CoA hydratase